MFQIIESSSAGNCAFLQYAGINILVDAGVGVRRISAYLASMGLEIGDIDAVFITHEHSDHCKALKNFTKYSGIKVFANRLTAESIRYLMPETKTLNWQIFETGSSFDFYGISVAPFSIPHDTSDAVGYCFGCGNRNLVWMTDLGKVTLAARDVALRANVLVLESNYCPVLLDNSSRPYSLKMRIKSSHGHLSNADAIELMAALDASKVEKIFLAHISKECNNMDHIRELLESSGRLSAILNKIEIVSPFSKRSSVFE